MVGLLMNKKICHYLLMSFQTFKNDVLLWNMKICFGPHNA